MNSDRKKELKNSYKSRPVIGGVCCLRCSGNQRVLVQKTKDTASLRNRYNFAMAVKTCPDPLMLEEWKEYGNEVFSFEVLEEIEKGENQTDKEFSDDIDMLYEIWLEKLQQGAL